MLPKFITKTTDLYTMLRCNYLQLSNKAGGLWNKFLGGGTRVSYSEVAAKMDDTVLSSPEALRLLFDRRGTTEAPGVEGFIDDYTSDTFGKLHSAILTKRESELLSSMQAAWAMRYIPRMRLLAATASTSLTTDELGLTSGFDTRLT